jgi:hypothetical protein
MQQMLTGRSRGVRHGKGFLPTRRSPRGSRTAARPPTQQETGVADIIADLTADLIAGLGTMV